MHFDDQAPDIKPTDLRGILRYVPQWRGHVFVIALDGAIVRDENFANILLDLAVLRSLHIRIVIVLGIGTPLQELAAARGVTLSDLRGEAPVDDATLDLAVEAAARVSHEVMRGLTANGLKCVAANAVRAAEAGILKGVDQMHRGKVDKVDAALLRELIDAEIVPLVPVIVFGRDGRTLRVNSDALASELSHALQASKLIFLTPYPGLHLSGRFVTNIKVEAVRDMLETEPEAIDEALRSKVRHAVRTIEGGTPRVHIMDGRISEGLLTEIFSKVGVGTMVYGNEYQQIRRARRFDIHAIHAITRNAVRTDALRYRTRSAIEKEIDRFFVYEIDDSVIGCAALVPYPGTEIGEIASVSVQPFYQNRGVGRKLVDFAILEAEQRGMQAVVALTTQSVAFFRDLCGFEEGSPSDLPPERRQIHEKSGRNSRVLVKRL